LLAGQDAHPGFSAEALFGPIGKPHADTVIAAQGVAAGEDEALGSA